MNDYRSIWLTNGLNQTFDDGNIRFFASLSGFGLQNQITSTRVGNSLLVSNTLPQLLVKNAELDLWGGTIQAYQSYLQFARFIQYEPLYLHYLTPNRTQGVFCQVKIVQVDKGEQGTDGIMRVPLQMQPLSMWFDEQQNVIQTSRVESQGKSYPLKRPYHYGALSTSNIELYNAGLNDAPIEIEVVGDVTDMQYNIYDENGERYGVGKILGTYDRIYINTGELDETIELERDGAVIANPYNYQDLSVGENDANSIVTFIKLKTGQSSLSFTLPMSFSGNITIRWRNTYATV